MENKDTEMPEELVNLKISYCGAHFNFIIYIDFFFIFKNYNNFFVNSFNAISIDFFNCAGKSSTNFFILFFLKIRRCSRKY